MITVAWHEVISWGLTILSSALLVSEYRKNDNTKYYMVLQGILRACNQRAGFLAHVMNDMRQSDRQVPRDEFLFVIDSEYLNYVALQEHIMGSMKSIQPDRDMPFDVGGFIRGPQPGQSAEV